MSRHRGDAPAVFGPPAPPASGAPGALWRPAPWVRALAWALACAFGGVLALAACTARAPKPTPASLEADAVGQVLEGMAEGLKARDATALASQWAPDAREEARARIRVALEREGAGSGPVELRFTPVAIRAEGRRRLARVAWEGTWGGRKVAGTFEMELTADEPPGIVAIRGEDPFAGPDAEAAPSAVPPAAEAPVP